MKTTENQRYIEKTIETSDFLNGGLLNPEQQSRFITLVKRFATLLPLSRELRVRMELDRLSVGVIDPRRFEIPRGWKRFELPAPAKAELDALRERLGR